MTSDRPLTYLSTECVVPYMSLYVRNSLSRQSPTFNHLYKKIPIRISRLQIKSRDGVTEIIADGVTYKLFRAPNAPSSQRPLNVLQIIDQTGRMKWEGYIRGCAYDANSYLFRFLLNNLRINALRVDDNIAHDYLCGNVDLKSWTLKNYEIKYIFILSYALLGIAQNVVLSRGIPLWTLSLKFKHPRIFLNYIFTDIEAIMFVQRSKYYARQAGYQVTEIIDSRERAIKIFNLIKRLKDYRVLEIQETKNTRFPECLSFSSGLEPLEVNIFLEEVEEGSIYHLHSKIEERGWADSQQ
ncbi:hypothetical protein CAEBREN_19363 [Caenorhabditis brenneri]|uniref:Uncharacterized protein n=1 Tax=Caenorhabditis brenneri TaxID=135651 RepID=G0MDF8_CAEBE|nr:hypothetical protein CAEBREN_19363 [Caenorhabditis brenneri]